MIAGSDSGSGAGVQADIKTIMALGGYGTTAITAITAQNTMSIIDVHAVPESVIHNQIQAILHDIGADAIKIGMLNNVATIRTVINAIKESVTLTCDGINGWMITSRVVP